MKRWGGETDNKKVNNESEIEMTVLRTTEVAWRLREEPDRPLVKAF